MLDDFPLAWDHFQCLGDVLSHLGQPPPAARWTGAGGGLDHPLARQVFGEWLAGGMSAHEGGDLGGLGCCRLGGDLICAGGGLQLLQLEFKLVEQTLCALRVGAEPLALELGDLQFEVGDLGLILRHLGTGRGQRLHGQARLGTGGNQSRHESVGIQRQVVGLAVHAEE